MNLNPSDPHEPDGPEEAPRPYFFLSYARSDDDLYVERFYRDLCGEVRVQAGLAATAEVGFLDAHSIEIGATWSDALVDAVSTCTTFLGLCSPRYIVSEPCGQEWQLFAERCRRFELDCGRRSTALLPVLWLPPRRLPEAVQRVQYDTSIFSEAYRRDGLRQLMRLRRYEDEYLDALTILAKHIVDNAVIDRLPPVPVAERSPFESVRSAFHTADPAGAPDPPVDPPAAQPDHVHFVVAAPSRQEATAVRHDVTFYGEAPLDWAPYHPTLTSPLAMFAREVAARRGLTADVSPVTVEPTGSPPPVDTVVRHRRIVVLLVDAWATQLDAYRRALLEHETRPDAAAAAMVPRSHEDHETNDNWRMLSDALRSIFIGRVAAGEAHSYRPEILTHGAFDEDLQVVLETARNRVFAHGARPPGEGTPGSGPAGEPPSTEPTRPILEGP